MGHDDDKAIGELGKSFELLLTNPASAANSERRHLDDRAWKLNDPVGYKKDMEDMCKAMFGDGWRVEYEALLREEFPEDYE